MKKLSLFVVALSCLHAQAVTLTLTGPATVQAGSSANLTLSISGSTGQSIAGVQWSTSLPSGITLGTPVIAPSLAPEGYAAYCGPVICLIAGSVTPVTDGILATIPINFSSSVAPGSSSLPISGLFAATNTGLNVNGLVSGTPLSIKALSPCDLNSDGTVNIADVQLVISSILTAASCPISSANGGCSLLTVIDEVIAATGGACKIP